MVDKSLNYGREQLLELSERMNPSVILDLGAGRGFDLDNFKKKYPAARTIGVECFENNCQQLTAKNHEVMKINIEENSIPLPDHSVDIIIANQVLEHCKEIFWIFHEATRVLKPNGLFIVGVPNLASLHNRVLMLFGRQPTSIQLWSAHVRGFTAPGLRSFLDNTFADGYEIELIRGANFYPFPGFIAKKLALCFPYLAVGIFFRLRKKKSYNGEFIRYPVTERLETNFNVGPS